MSAGNIRELRNMISEEPNIRRETNKKEGENTKLGEGWEFIDTKTVIMLLNSTYVEAYNL